MSRHDDYRRYAKEAQEQADAAKSDTDRAGWLKIAQGWLGLTTRRQIESPQEQFDAQVGAKGTGQTPSDTSH